MSHIEVTSLICKRGAEVSPDLTYTSNGTQTVIQVIIEAYIFVSQGFVAFFVGVEPTPSGAFGGI